MRVIWRVFWRVAIILHINDRGKETAVSGSCSLGFYKFTGTTLGANKAFLALDAVVNNAREFRFSLDEETTAVFDLKNKEESIKNSWYTLDGRKLNGEPKQRGIYVKNGRKIIVK